MSGDSFRRHLSMPGMLRAVRACLDLGYGRNGTANPFMLTAPWTAGAM